MALPSLFYRPDGGIRWPVFAGIWIVLPAAFVCVLSFLDPNGYLLALVVTVAALAGTVLALLIAAVRRSRTQALISLAIAVAALGSCQVSRIGFDRIIDGREAVAAPVIKAIGLFHTDTGHYPARLEELVPKYVPAVPVEFRDDTLRYNRFGGADYPSDPRPERPERFIIFFRGMAIQEWAWNDDRQQWDMLD